MNKYTIAWLFFFICLGAGAQKATIKIDIDRTIGEVDPKIYGVFMEPITFRRSIPEAQTEGSFNTLYGTLYDPNSPLADEHGFRTDYIEAMKELKVTNMRWPGGNYVAGYNWQDGIGPKEKRPVRKDLAWGGIDNNHVGTHEWVQLNRSMGSENVVCVNLGLGTINDARYWVEYCNLAGGTSWSDLRIENGQMEPFRIKYWCLGNEVDGAPWIMGYKNAEDYCKIAIEAAKAMRATDNSIKLVACGSSRYSGPWIDWNWTVISELREFADYLSIHRYWERSDDYYEYVGQSSFDIEEKITTTEALIKAARVKYPDMRPLYLSVDEWAPFGGSIQSTLAVAMNLNSFIRHADIVKMANYTLMISLLGRDPERGTFKTPLFHTFKMFSTNCLGNSVDTYVLCDTFNTERYDGIPYLDVTSVYSEESGDLFVNVVNRHRDNPITAELLSTSGSFKGSAVTRIVTGEELMAPFTYDNRDRYDPQVEEIRSGKNSFTATFPPHSFTQIHVGIQKQ